jgi:Zn finger protein HypA/HybF involved in hydrogenase expression
MNPVTEINISENLNQCMTCDFTGNEWAEHPQTKECVCPVCLSTDYYIIEEEEA